MNKNELKSLKRLNVDIPKEIHDKLKYIGIFRNCSIRKLVIRALLAYIRFEEKTK